MRKRLVFALIVLMSTWLAGSAWATEYADTLYPDVDGNYTGWFTKTFLADEYEEIDDPQLSCGADTTTYLYTVGPGSVSSWEISDPTDTTDKDIDSAAIEYEMQHQSDGSTTGEAKVAIGWAMNYVPWDVCALGTPGYDTVTLTPACEVYRVVWAEDPCQFEGEPFEWVMFGFYSDDYYQPFIWSISVRSGCGVSACQNRCFNVRVIVYSHSTGEEPPAGNPATKKKKTLGGIYEEEDFHIPRLADCDWLQ